MRTGTLTAALVLATAVMLLTGVLIVAASQEDDGVRYRVTVTNITRGQILSPAVVVSTRGQISLFSLGSPASAELAAVAEDAINGPLVAALSENPRVKQVREMSGPILPGHSASVTIAGAGGRDQIGIVSMLVTTNDAFFALNGVNAPREGTTTHFSVAYDAGSERNNEKCAFIPGPPCGNVGKRDTVGAEGFVHVHAGIHGTADLKPDMHDWRNPVALIRIARL